MKQSWTTRAWRHAVAAYVLFHIASILIGSLPGPTDALSRVAWQDPTVQDEFAAWSQRLSHFGLAVEPEELQEAARKTLESWIRFRQAMMTPFRAYQEYSGTVQSWSMFVAPHRYPSVLHVDIREPNGDWRPIYVERSGEWTWRRAQFDHIRLRSAIFRYAWPQFKGTWQQFAGWLAAQAACDFRTASQLRVRLYKYRTPDPEEARAGRKPPGEFVRAITLELDAHR